jgi:hypothetical protein
MNPRIESLEKMLGGPRDGALLRFSLGNEYLKADDPAKAGKMLPGSRRPRQTLFRRLESARQGAGRSIAQHLPIFNVSLQNGTATQYAGAGVGALSAHTHPGIAAQCHSPQNSFASASLPYFLPAWERAP